LGIKVFINEIKRRKVLKSVLAYLAVAWILLQVFSILLPMVEAPKWVLKTFTVIMLAGFPIWVTFSWKYQISSEGVKKIEANNFHLSNGFKFLGFFMALIFVGTTGFFILRSGKKYVNDVTSDNPNAEEVKKDDNLSTNLEALDYYLKGEFHLKRESLSDINMAIENYQKAIKHDSLFDLAYSHLASAYMRKNLSFEPNEKWEEEAYSAAGKALQLNPKLANPHIIQGQFFWSPSHNFAHEEAINEFKIAISKDSTISQAYEQLALVQLHIGLFDKALKNTQKSVALDPFNYRTRRFIGEIFLFQGNYEEAMIHFNKIPKNFVPQPTQAFKAFTYFHLNQPEMATQILQENLPDYPISPHLNSVYAIILASKGEKEEALKKMETARQNIDDYVHAHHIYYYLGIASALLGYNKDAVDWLQKAADSGFPNYPLFNSDPNLKSLKNDNNFLNLLSKLKLEWKNYMELS